MIPIKAFELGCQFVSMEFQYIDNNMDMYITKFKNKSMLLKHNKLRKGSQNNFKNIKKNLNNVEINDEEMNDEEMNDEEMNDEEMNDEEMNDEY